MLNYCSSCSRVFDSKADFCPHCESIYFSELKKNAPVNVIGSKVKGRLFKVTGETALLIVITENKEKLLKEYPIKELRKIN
ncbi:MAG: hypothetical protein ACRCWM_04915 [Sarcina sp.]